MSSQEKAESHAAKGEFEEALKIGLEMKGLSVEFDLKLVEWATRNHDLILAANIIDKDAHGAWISDPTKRDVYVALHQDPEAWLEAAQYQQRQGDYLKALQHADYALDLTQNHVRANGPSVSYTSVPAEDRPYQKILEARVREYRDALRTEIQGLKTRLETIQQEAAQEERTATGALRDQAAVLNKDYSDLLFQIDSLGSLKPERTDLSRLAYEAKIKILGGVLRGNDRLLQEGIKISQELERYTALEPAAAAQDEALDRMTVPNSRFALEMVAEGIRGPVGPFEMAPAETLRVRQDVKFYDDLKKKNDPLAREWDRIIEHRKATAIFRGQPLYEADGTISSGIDDYDPSKDGRLISYREKAPGTLEELRELIQGIQERGDVVARIGDAFNKNISKGSSTETIEDLSETIKAHHQFSGYVALLDEAASSGSPQADLVQKVREFLIDRGEQYNRYFSKKKEELLKRHEDFRIKASHEGVGAMSKRLDHLRTQWLSIEAELEELKSIQAPGTPEATAKAIEVLGKAAPRILAANETRIQASLEDAVETLPDAKSIKANLHALSDPRLRLIDGVGQILMGSFSCLLPANGARESLMDARAGAYERLYWDVRKKALPFEIGQQIKGLKDQRKRAGWGDYLSDVVHGRILAHHDDPFSAKIHELEEAKRLVTSADPLEREKGLSLLSILDGASINQSIKSKNGSSWWGLDLLVHPKEFVLDTLKTAGAALIAFAGGRLFGPSFGRYLGGELGANAFTFTVSHRLLNGLAHGRFVHELKRLVTDPVGTLKETLLMAGMMKFVGKVSKLATKGAIKLGIEGGGKLWMIGFGAEIAGFRGWQLTEGIFIDGNVRNLSDLKAILLQNPLNDAAFIGLLQVVGVLHSPVSGRLDGSMESIALKMKGLDAKKMKLDRQVDQLAEIAGVLSQTSRGNISKLLELEEMALLERGSYLKEIPAGLRDEVYDAAVSLNDQALANVRQFRDAYGRSIFKGMDVAGKNPFGLQTVREGLFRYSGSRGVDLMRTLKANPSVSNMTVHDNGLVVVEMTDPVGRPTTLKLYDRAYNADIKAMQKFLRSNTGHVETLRPEPRKESSDEPAETIFPGAVPAAAGAAGGV